MSIDFFDEETGKLIVKSATFDVGDAQPPWCVSFAGCVAPHREARRREYNAATLGETVRRLACGRSKLTIEQQ
jgi:hypothetical protein